MNFEHTKGQPLKRGLVLWRQDVRRGGSAAVRYSSAVLA
jgi:ribosomal protein L15E